MVKESFYRYVCSLVFNNARKELNNATVIIDKSGSKDFRSQLAKYIKKKMNTDWLEKSVKKVRTERSSSNNLLQLADYIAGIIHKRAQGKQKFQRFYKYVSARESHVQTWPNE